MRLSNIQNDFRTALMASPLLANFAPFLIEDGSDQEAALVAALEARGACLVIDDIMLGELASTNSGRTLFSVSVTLAIYELPAVNHSPAGIALLEEAIAAATSRGLFECTGWDKFANASGGTVTFGDFKAKVTVGGLS